IKVFTLGNPAGRPPIYGLGDAPEVDAGLEVRIPVKAGTHTVGVSFVQDSWDIEGVGLSRLPLANDAYSRGRTTSPSFGRIDMGLDSIEIDGPFDAATPAESTVRRRLFTCQPAGPRDEEPCAKAILSSLARRAYRRPVTDAEVTSLMDFYRK